MRLAMLAFFALLNVEQVPALDQTQDSGSGLREKKGTQLFLS